MTQEPSDADAIAARFADLFGRGWRVELADALEIRRPTITEQFSRGRVQPWLVALLEVFEAIPPKKWPRRWVRLAALAEARKAKASA